MYIYYRVFVDISIYPRFNGKHILYILYTIYNLVYNLTGSMTLNPSGLVKKANSLAGSQLGTVQDAR